MNNLHKSVPLPRHARHRLHAALADTPVVLLSGARQTGKTTLARTLLPGSLYVTLDDAATRLAAQADTDGFLAGLLAQSPQDTVIVDEAQRVPNLFRAVKAAVDRDRRPGRLLLTGSANLFLLPDAVESLAGRMEIIPLWSLAQSEIETQTLSLENPVFLLDMLFEPDWAARLGHTAWNPTTRPDLLRRIVAGGFPEPRLRNASRRRAWFENYVSALLLRDLPDIARIENAAALPRLLRLLASRAAGLLNLSDVASGVGLPYATLRRYVTLLETLYLVYLLPAWSANRGLRLVKAPKLLLSDTGLLCYLLGFDESGLAQSPLLGAALENFALLEVVRWADTSANPPSLFHFRDTQQHECDLVMEHKDGRVFGIEIKAATLPTKEDFRGLRALQSAAAEQFAGGLVLCGADIVSPFGANLFAAPLSLLWQSEERNS